MERERRDSWGTEETVGGKVRAEMTSSLKSWPAEEWSEWRGCLGFPSCSREALGAQAGRQERETGKLCSLANVGNGNDGMGLVSRREDRTVGLENCFSVSPALGGSCWL